LKNKILNIAYSCNEAYIAHTGISILSLLQNNTHFEEINIYFIHIDVAQSSLEKLQKLVSSDNRILHLIPFDKICGNLNISEIGRHTETVYAKLFFGNIKGVDRIFYIDSDTVIQGPLDDAWDMDLKNCYFGLVKTMTRDSNELLGLSKEATVYNDGVAMVNAKLLREDAMEEKFLAFIDRFNGKPPVLSEGTINVVCNGKIATMHPKFNFSPIFYMGSNKKLFKILKSKTYFTNKELSEARENPIIIHYLSGWFLRPWEKNCTHPLKDRYLYYKSASPWAHVPLQDKKLTKSAKRMKLGFKYIPVWLFHLLRDIKQRLN
jgi:lipopolysaccharide biosynthesis glycosyltransferase